VSTTRGQHLIGQEIGSCILEKLLGYGGSSAVFLAQNSSSGETVAVKVFLPRSTMDKQTHKNFYRRFLREAQAASELDHPNILPIYSYGEHHGLPYIVMPYMPGGTLSEYVSSYGPLSLNEAQHYLEQISSALDYAHTHGCVHCDVKPANILLDGTGHAMLSDFGIVRLMQPEDATVQQSMKSSDTLMGTPDYVSPEQALGERLDGRSDIYSLGVTLFFLLAGSPPFKAESSIAMALMHVHETPPVLGTMRVDITPQIDKVIAKALSKWPKDRFQTAGEFSTAFAEAVAFSDSNADSDQAIAALKPIVRIKPVLQGPSKLLRVVLLLVLLLVIVIGSIITGNVANTFLHTHPSRVQPTSTATPIDYLADEQSAWTLGPTYFFQNGQYHILNKSRAGMAMAFYNLGISSFSDFRLTVSTSEIRGTHNGGDYYGIILRSTSDQLHYYLFEIASWNGGQYVFWRHDKQWHEIQDGNLSGLLPDFRQRNVITAQVQGNSFTFFINQKRVGNTMTDPSIQPINTGYIGLSVEGQNTEVAFSHLQIQKL
jgi:eukaryotic-like serine/threonine-protein kinase